MKKLNIMISVLIVLILSSIVSAVTIPIPDLQLKPGEEGKFYFSTDSSQYLSKCTITLDHKTPLIIEFYDSKAVYGENPVIIIEPNTRHAIYGSVKVPETMTNGKYTETFCISCVPAESAGGTSVIGHNCNIPINVEVVNARTQENISLPEKPEQKVEPMIIFVILVVIVIILILLFTYFRRKNKPTKQTRKK